MTHDIGLSTQKANASFSKYFRTEPLIFKIFTTPYRPNINPVRHKKFIFENGKHFGGKKSLQAVT